MTIDVIIAYIQKFEWVAPALAGGLVDYLSIVKRDKRKCKFSGSIIHAVSALFFGWLSGEVAIAAGVAQMSPDMALDTLRESRAAYTSAVAVGGLMGTRIGEIIVFVIKKKAGLLVED